MTEADLRLHAAALVGQLATDNRAEAVAVIDHMKWLAENWVFQSEEAEPGRVIRLVTPLEAR